MIKDITIGQYFPGDTPIHNIDPRVKIILTFVYIVALFVVDNILGFLVVFSLILSVILLAKLSIKIVLKGLKPIVMLVAFTSVINIFFTTGDPLISGLDWGMFTPTKQGLYNAIFVVIRVVLLIVGTSVLTYTTSPILLTDGMESLMNPLKYIKVPVHDISMMMTIALRFIPTLIEETDKIMSAQKSRGADFETGGLIKKAKALIPILIPLFVSAFRRAEDLAIAMECRCYNGGKGRTRLRKYELQTRDYMSLFVMALFLAAIILLNMIG